MRTVGGYRIVQSDADAISLGYPNAASYRLAVRREIDRENEKAYAEDVAKHQARLTKKLQTPPIRLHSTSGPFRRRSKASDGRWCCRSAGGHPRAGD